MLTCGTACKKVNINKCKWRVERTCGEGEGGVGVCLTCESPFFLVMMDLDHKR